MAFCINCGQRLVNNAKFCPNCGAAVNGDSSRTKRKTVFEGMIHKCPNCGEVLNSFVTNCPTCGYEIRDTHGVSSVKNLEMKLEQLEAKRPPKRRTNIFAQFLGNGEQLQSIDEQKINIIRNFSIPNTKEDILEFIILASANIDLKVYGLDSSRYQMFDPAHRELSDAWLAKLEQSTQKAEIMFGQTQEYLFMRNIYKNKIKAIKKKKHQIIWLCTGVLVAVFLTFALVLLFIKCIN